MELNDIEINVGEFIYFQGLYIFRNEYAYLVFKSLDSEEYFGSVLFFNDNFYCVETVSDLRSYKVNDFI